MSIQHRADWRKIFEDFDSLRYTLDELSQRTGTPLEDLRRASAGIVQNRFVGDRIIATWCHLTMKSMEFVPLLPTAPAAARTQTAPALEPEAPSATRSVEALMHAWRRLPRD